MTAARILHIDDEPEIREAVRMSLDLDPEMTVRSCASGSEAIATIDDWLPDLVLLDAMMPTIDGPMTLAMLRKRRGTAAIPVVFTTAKVQTSELEYFKSLGAAGVMAKPLDPSTLAGALRDFLKSKPPRLDIMEQEFLGRARKDANELLGCRTALTAGRHGTETLFRVRQIAHGLAGAGGIFGYHAISDNATSLEEVMIAKGTDAEIRSAIDTLLARISETVLDRSRCSVGRSRRRLRRAHAGASQ
jgi:CheY-like chemotaxis protein